MAFFNITLSESRRWCYCCEFKSPFLQRYMSERGANWIPTIPSVQYLRLMGHKKNKITHSSFLLAFVFPCCSSFSFSRNCSVSNRSRSISARQLGSLQLCVVIASCWFPCILWSVGFCQRKPDAWISFRYVEMCVIQFFLPEQIFRVIYGSVTLSNDDSDH